MDDGPNAMEATIELAEAVKSLVGLLRDGGTVPEEMIPGWVGGAVVTALVEAIHA